MKRFRAPEWLTARIDSNAREASSRMKQHLSGWRTEEAVIVGLSALAATAIDVMVVRVPADMHFLGKHVAGSPVTQFVKRHSSRLHERLGKPLENIAKVPYDFPHHKSVAGLRPKLHRVMSPGHDPLLGLIHGVRDLMRGQATLVDKDGVTRVLSTEHDPLGFTAAVVRWLAHLLSDVFTKAGLPAPGLSALLTVKSRSPFRLRPDGDLVPWKDVARWMYGQGYDLRHFLTQGLTPATVELVVRGYWLLEHYGKEIAQADRDRLDEMLLAAHSLVLGGNLLKVALTRNPLYFNAAQLSAVGLRLGSITLKKGYRKARIARIAPTA